MGRKAAVLDERTLRTKGRGCRAVAHCLGADRNGHVQVPSGGQARRVAARPRAWGRLGGEGFRAICRRLREGGGLDGDGAFFRMSGMDTGAPGMTDRTPAALAVPAHPFEKREVFEG